AGARAAPMPLRLATTARAVRRRGRAGTQPRPRSQPPGFGGTAPRKGAVRGRARPRARKREGGVGPSAFVEVAAQPVIKACRAWRVALLDQVDRSLRKLHGARRGPGLAGKLGCPGAELSEVDLQDSSASATASQSVSACSRFAIRAVRAPTALQSREAGVRDITSGGRGEAHDALRRPVEASDA